MAEKRRKQPHPAPKPPARAIRKSTAEKPATKPSAAKAAAPDPIPAEAIRTEGIAAEPIPAEAIVAEAIVTEPIVAEPIVAEPADGEAVAAEPIDGEADAPRSVQRPAAYAGVASAWALAAPITWFGLASSGLRLYAALTKNAIDWQREALRR